MDRDPAEVFEGSGPTPPRGSRFIGAAWLSGLPLLVNAVSLLANFYIVPALGPEAWGVWSTALGLSGATSFVVGLGIRPIFIRALARAGDPARRRQLIRSQLALRILLALLAGAAALTIGLVLGYDPLILACAAIAAIGLVPAVVWTVFSDVLNAEESFRAAALASMVAGLALTGATIVVVHLDYGPIGVATAYLVGPALTAALLGVQVRRRGYAVSPSWDRAELGALTREARMTAAGDGVGTLLTRLNGIYVPAIIGHVAYGFFTTGMLLVTRLTVIGDALVTVYTPEVSRERDRLLQGQPTWSSRTMLRLLLVAGSVLGVGALAVSAWFVGLIYHDPSQAASRQYALLVMAIASASVPIGFLGMGWRQLLIAVDHHDLAARVSAQSAALGAAVTVALTLQWGGAGAAAGVVANAAANAGILWWVGRRHLGGAAALPHRYAGALAWAVGAAVGMLAVSRGLSVSGALLLVGAPIVTLLVLAALGVIGRADLAMMKGRVAGRIKVAGINRTP